MSLANAGQKSMADRYSIPRKYAHLVNMEKAIAYFKYLNSSEGSVSGFLDYLSIKQMERQKREWL